MMKFLVAALLLGAPSARAAAITAGQNVTSVSAGALQPAGPGAYSGNLVNNPGLAYSSTFLLDLAQYGAAQVSVQSVVSTDTIASASISDGRQSSGTITVTDYASLSAAQATIRVTVTTNAFTTLPTLTFANCSLTMGKQFSKGSTKLATAQNLAAAITDCNSSIAAAAAPNAVIYATATAGSYANAYIFTSNNSSVTVSASQMSGGRDNAVLTINDVALTQGTDFSAVTSSAVTAANLATAISASSLGTTLSVSSNVGAAYGIITLASKFNGTAYNYDIESSTPTALTVKDGANLIGGLDSGFTLGSALIRTTAEPGFFLGIPVLYSSGTVAVGGLTNQTTYYAVPVGNGALYLSRCSSCAVAQSSTDYVTITSTNSGASANTFTLAPLAWSGSATWVLQTSNDASSWSTAPSTGTVTVTNTTTSGTTLSVNFGTLGYRYLRLNYTAPTVGALNIRVPVYLQRD